jgi:hypothetical protein
MDAATQEVESIGSPPRALEPGHWLAQPLKHPRTGALLLPAGTVFSRELIQKVRSLGVEFDAVVRLGKGQPTRGRLNAANLVEHYDRQRFTGERLADAFGAMRDMSFGLFCIAAVLAFATSSAQFAILAAIMLVAMLTNAWLSNQALQRLSTLNRMFAGFSPYRVRA